MQSPIAVVLRMVLAATASSGGSAAAYDWPQFGFDAQKSGNNALEHRISRDTVNQLVRKWQITLPGNADGAPIVLQGVPTSAGTYTTLVFVNTTNGYLRAYDARNGSLLWSKSTSGASPAMTTSPAIDPNQQYVYSYGLDGFVHKYAVADGTETLTGGWPQLATLKGAVEKHGGSLAIATVGNTSYLYVVQGGYPGDAGNYQGHVTTIDLSTGLQNVFNAACSNTSGPGGGIASPGAHLAQNDPRCPSSVRNAVWARPGVVFHAPTNRVLFATGNGGTWNGTTQWSESILAMNPDGSGAAGMPIDSFTPTNWLALDQADADLGSTAPVVLKTPPGATIPYVAMQGGKDALLRLVDISNLSGQGGPGHTGGEWNAIGIPQGGVLLTQPATWIDPADGSSWTFVANGNGASGFKVALDGANKPMLSKQWQNAIGSASPIVANGVVFATGSQVRALDATTGLPLLSSTFAAGNHFHTPTVANGELYVTDNAGRLTAYFLPGPKLDMDGDGRDDVLWRDTTGALAFHRMTGTGATWLPIGGSSTAWQVQGLGDFDGDGRVDVLFREAATGNLGIYFMNGPTPTWGFVGGSSTAWTIVGIGDFDGNGKSDILFRDNVSGNLGIDFMNGVTATWAPVGGSSPAWTVQAVADFDGDGKSDILFRETATGSLGIDFMNGATATWGPVGGASTAWIVQGAADFNGDGKADILFRHPPTGDLGIYFMNGAAATWMPSVISAPSWSIEALGDYDGDGKADIYWREAATGNIGVYLMKDAAAAWLPLGNVPTFWQVQ